jgi:His/Glu/Gln/Arg/opine family amino acid ABC transporter permease subunit
MSVFDIIAQYHVGLIQGLIVTFKLAMIIWFFGLLLGGVLGCASARWKKSIGVPARLCSFLLSGIPILVFLFWFHYPMQAILNVVIDPFITAVVALTIVNMFMVADLIRNVLAEFPDQYITAAKVCGLSPMQTLFDIQLPLILRQSIPGLLMIQVNMLQATLFASLISVDEIFRVAQRINSIVYRPVEVFTALAILFLIICLPLNGLALWLKNRFTRRVFER